MNLGFKKTQKKIYSLHIRMEFVLCFVLSFFPFLGFATTALPVKESQTPIIIGKESISISQNTISNIPTLHKNTEQKVQSALLYIENGTVITNKESFYIVEENTSIKKSVSKEEQPLVKIKRKKNTEHHEKKILAHTPIKTECKSCSSDQHFAQKNSSSRIAINPSTATGKKAIVSRGINIQWFGFSFKNQRTLRYTISFHSKRKQKVNFLRPPPALV